MKRNAAAKESLLGRSMAKLRPVFFLLVVSLLSAPINLWAEKEESDGPYSAVSPDQLFSSLLDRTFNNPTGIRAGEEYFLYVQSTGGEPASTPWAWCWGDPIVLFSSPWSFEGLRQPFALESRISPCTCTDPACPEEDKFAYGTGSVLRSNHDGNFYIFLDKVLPGRDVAAGDFKDILLGTSPDGRNWTYPTEVSPLVTQSTICEGAACTTVSILDVTLTADVSSWWGFFKWGVLGEQANRTGRMRVFPDASNPRGFRVELLSAGQWQPVADDGTFSAIPDDVWPNVSVNSLLQTPEGFEAWAWKLSSEQVAGCDDGTDVGSEIVYRRAGQDTLDPVETLRSRVRAIPSRNMTGRTFPVLLEGPAGYTSIYSSSSQRVCETQHALWLANNNPFAGMEIVLTTLTDSVIEDRFTNTSTRLPDTPLQNTRTEVGERTWSTSPSALMGEDLVVAADGASNVPFLPSDFPGEPFIEITADIDTQDSLWTGIGLSSGLVGGYFGVGQVWMNLHSTGAWSLFADGTTHSLDSGQAPIFHSQGFNHLKFRYDAQANTAEAWVNGCRVSAPMIVVPFSPNVQAAGFHAFDPASEIAGGSRIDNFKIRVGEPPIFDDGFECGDLSSWQVGP